MHPYCAGALVALNYLSTRSTSVDIHCLPKASLGLFVCFITERLNNAVKSCTSTLVLYCIISFQHFHVTATSEFEQLFKLYHHTNTCHFIWRMNVTKSPLELPLLGVPFSRLTNGQSKHMLRAVSLLDKAPAKSQST